MNVSLDIGLFFFRDAQFEKCSTGVKKKVIAATDYYFDCYDYVVCLCPDF